MSARQENNSACDCVQNDEGRTIKFCRGCAALVEQRTPEWYQTRCGFCTGSRVVDVTRKTQRGWSTKRYSYMDQLLAERLTGIPQGVKSIRSLDWRAEQEPDARAAYSFDRDVDVVQVGFIHHPFIEFFGCSPDGYVGDDGITEIKKLDPAQHIKLLEGGDREESVLEEYVPQIYSGLACTSREWCDFISYCPEMLEPDDRLYVRTYRRDEQAISTLECSVRDFLAELVDKVEHVRNRGRSGQSASLEAQLSGSIAMLQPDSMVVPMKRKRKAVKS